jgi:fructuronate reductase
MRYASGFDEAGRPIKVSDPMAARFAAIAEIHRSDPAALAREMLAIHEIFDEDLHNEPRFANPVREWLQRLYEQGAAATVAEAVRTP